MGKIDLQIEKGRITIFINEAEYLVDGGDLVYPCLFLKKTNKVCIGLDKDINYKIIQYIPSKDKHRLVLLYNNIKIFEDGDVSDEDKFLNELIVSKLCKYFGVDKSMKGILGAVVNQHLNQEPIDLTKALHKVFPIMGINYFEFLEQSNHSCLEDIMFHWVIGMHHIGMFNIDYKILKPITKLQYNFIFDENISLFQLLSNLSCMSIPKGSIDINWSEKRMYAEYKHYASKHSITHLKSLPEYNYGKGLDLLTSNGYNVLRSVYEICDLGIRTGNCLMTYYQGNTIREMDGYLFPNSTFITKGDVIYKVEHNFAKSTMFITEYKKSFNREVHKFDCDVLELEMLLSTIDIKEFILPMKREEEYI